MLQLFIVPISLNGESIVGATVHVSNPKLFRCTLRDFLKNNSGGKQGKMAWIILKDTEGKEVNRFLKKFDGTIHNKHGKEISFFKNGVK